MSGVVPWSRQKASLEELPLDVVQSRCQLRLAAIMGQILRELTAESIRGTGAGG